MRHALTFLTYVALGFGLVMLLAHDPNEMTITYDPPPTNASSMDMAKTYADEHGLTDCGAPEDADLDDTFLVRDVDDSMTAVGGIYRVDLDTALDSAGKRLVLLACKEN